MRGIHHVHFVGIGGIGMCGLAELLHHQGYHVTGSDLREGDGVARLRDLGLAVAIGHDRVHVGAAQVVVVSSAIRADNPEIAEARARGIPVVGRGELLAEVMRGHEGIAVAGSHGKTTTTSLIAHLLGAAGLDPTAVIGGRVLGSGVRTGTRLGGGRWLVAEADESDGSFLHLAPVISVITNVDPEHLDHYGTLDRLRDAFAAFANRVPFFGLVVLGIDHPGVQAIAPRITRRTTTYGFSEGAEWVARDVATDGGGMRFEVTRAGVALGPVTLPIPGRHNVQNALAALAVAAELGIEFGDAAAALARFRGVERRFERRGEVGGITVVDDYAHHPAEVRATLAAARGVHRGRIVAVFQPHRYTRTRDCLDEFATAFDDADRVWVTEIYSAGETPLDGIDGAALAARIRGHGHRGVDFAERLDEVAVRLAAELVPGDWVLTLGAGDVSKLGPLLLERLRARSPR